MPSAPLRFAPGTGGLRPPKSTARWGSLSASLRVLRPPPDPGRWVAQGATRWTRFARRSPVPQSLHCAPLFDRSLRSRVLALAFGCAQIPSFLLAYKAVTVPSLHAKKNIKIRAYLNNFWVNKVSISNLSIDKKFCRIFRNGNTEVSQYTVALHILDMCKREIRSRKYPSGFVLEVHMVKKAFPGRFDRYSATLKRVFQILVKNGYATMHKEQRYSYVDTAIIIDLEKISSILGK